MRLSVTAVCGTSRVFRDDGEKLRSDIERLWASGEKIEIDFENVRIASVSFLDEAVAMLALTKTLDEVKAHVGVVNITPPDRTLLNSLLAARSRERLAKDSPATP